MPRHLIRCNHPPQSQRIMPYYTKNVCGNKKMKRPIKKTNQKYLRYFSNKTTKKNSGCKFLFLHVQSRQKKNNCSVANSVSSNFQYGKIIQTKKLKSKNILHNSQGNKTSSILIKRYRQKKIISTVQSLRIIMTLKVSSIFF